MNIPKIRFKQNNGENFPDWAQVKIYSLGEFIRGQTYSRDQVTLDPSATFIVRSSNLIDGWFVDFCKDKQLANVEVSDNELLKSGDVVICTANGSTSLVGKASIHDGRYSGSISWGAFCSVFRSNQEAPLAKYFFRTPRYRKLITSMKQGGNGALGNLNVKEITNVSIPFPCAEEQQKIASFFSTLDQKIELNERKLEALEKLKKGVTQKILNKKIRFQKDDGTDFPDTVSCSLRDISAYSKCIVEKKNSLFIGNEQLISNFGGATLNFREVAKGNEFNSGDILFGNIRPYLKKVWLSNESGVASPDVLIFKATNAIPGYLKFILSSERFFNHVAQGYKGSKMPRGDKHQIMDFSIQCPCLEEQQKIADFLSALDSKIDIKRKTVATMRDLKRGLMQQMFV